MVPSIVLALAAQTAPAPVAEPTVQQAFETATKLQLDGKYAEALSAWEALDRRVPNNRRTLAVIAARKASALFKLNRRDDATTAARLALAGMPAGDPTLRQDRYDTTLLLAAVAQRALDYAGALDEFTAAEAIAVGPSEKLGALLGEAETAIFVAPDRAKPALDKADALMTGQKVAPTVTADFQRQRALLLLNTGDVTGGRRMATKAVSTLGGLSLRVDLRDVQARSDVALAALLDKDEEEARRYMAYTGAGRFKKGADFRAGSLSPPDCGGEAGLKPSDVAVIQFSINEDGSVSDSEPIYAAGGGLVALEFARATRQWTWTPEAVKELPPFFRRNVRLEMRCSVAFQRPSLEDSLTAELAEWLRSKGVTLTIDDRRVASRQVDTLRAALVAAGTGTDSDLKAAPILYRLIVNPAVGREETLIHGARLMAIVDRLKGPPLARLAVAVPMTRAMSAQDSRNAMRMRTEALLADPVFAADAQARAVLRLQLSDMYKAGAPQTITLLQEVANDAALDAKDPLKVGALVRLASAEKMAGRLTEARQAFEKSGVAADQCALLDKGPAMLKFDAEFPTDAQRWGFEGWAQVENDVDAEGKALNTRVVAAYPPFVFSDSARRLFDSARYAKTFRPDGGLGCGGRTNRVNFRLPG
ncbi:hypothetical protein [uncultured Sphingomonas sp.]|uniref:hypothetical protein n=1 Tax=uncultured Sphingomonas sp. TaxID=158754 RepID=UPI0025E43F32|nr:hypothetical protein [uncultured Sphingomonas sp.]